MKDYIIRAVKCMLQDTIVIMAFLWIMWYMNLKDLVSFTETLAGVFIQPKGIAVIVLILLHPFISYVRRKVSGNIATDREQIESAARVLGLKLVSEKNGELVYRATGIRNIMVLFEPVVRIRQNGDHLEIRGLRRFAVNMAADIDRYITNIRRIQHNENE